MANPIRQTDTLFDSMIEGSEEHTNSEINEINKYEKKQSELQQEQSDYLIQQINQKKEQTHQSYIKEQSAAYTDYQKEIDPYGVQAEQTAAGGLSGSGYAESLKTQAYVAYQNRVAVARQAYQSAVVDYDNAMTEARIQNNVVMAQIAYQALQARLQAIITGFQRKNQFILEKANTRYKLAQENSEAWQEMLEQIYVNTPAENNSESVFYGPPPPPAE